ncbi:MAG TPA: hypothetical protein VJV40_02585, partial [Thermodesulfobacteriota bacterium]|nr:hypothetical protein [Thermodesulfobacteriota bacterium]
RLYPTRSGEWGDEGVEGVVDDFPGPVHPSTSSRLRPPPSLKLLRIIRLRPASRTNGFKRMKDEILKQVQDDKIKSPLIPLFLRGKLKAIDEISRVVG